LPVLAQNGPGPSFTITSISPFAGPSQPLHIALDVTNPGPAPLEASGIRVTLLQRVHTRSELRQALDGKPRGDVLAVTTEELAGPFQPGETRHVDISRDLGTLASTFQSTQDGVYPIKVELRTGGQTIQESASAIPFFSVPPEAKLNVVWVFPIHIPASFDAKNAYGSAIQQAVQPGGKLDQIVQALSRHPELPLTLAPTALTLDQLADLGNARGYVSHSARGPDEAVHGDDPRVLAARTIAENLRRIASNQHVEIASTTYARADVVGLVHNGMGRELIRQFEHEQELDEALIGERPPGTLMFPAGGNIDAKSAVNLAAAGARTVILAAEALPERRTRFGYDRTQAVVGGASVQMNALVLDPAIRDRMSAGTDPVLATQGVFAETAASYFELPSLAPERLLVVGTPLMPDPKIAAALLDGFASAPWITMRTASDAVNTLAATEEPIPLPIAHPVDRAPLSAARAARRTVEILGRVIEEERPVGLLERFILAAESADWISAPGHGSILARAARGSAERTLGLIKIPPRQVTFTSRVAQIPVTVENDTAGPIKVRLHLDTTKIRFPDGATRVLAVPERFLTVTFRAEARVTGSFPLKVRIETPDGRNVVGEGQIIVRSTAVNAVTLAATGGGALLLIAGWTRRFFRTRRRGGGPA
jgi:hypothetical protein